MTLTLIQGSLLWSTLRSLNCNKDFIEMTVMSPLLWEQWLYYLQFLTHRTLFPFLSFSPIYPSLTSPGMLYILLSKQISLDRLILMLLAILRFHMGINSLSGKRTPSSNNSCKVRAFLSSKRGKRKITEVKEVAMLTKWMK